MPSITPYSPCWDVLARLHEHSLIYDPLNRNKSICFTEEGLRESERLFNQHFVRD